MSVLMCVSWLCLDLGYIFPGYESQCLGYVCAVLCQCPDQACVNVHVYIEVVSWAPGCDLYFKYVICKKKISFIIPDSSVPTGLG